MANPSKNERAKSVKKTGNGELALPSGDSWPSVADFLNRRGKPLTLESAKAISRGSWVVLGQCSKYLPLEAVMGSMVVPRSQERAALERDDVLVRLIEHEERYAAARVHSLAEVAGILPKGPRQAQFHKLLTERAASSRPWPARLGFLQGSRQGYLFLLEHVVRSGEASRPVAVGDANFSRAFKEAFERLRRGRPFNMVELAALRDALPDYSREQFDGGLRELRKSREFVLRAFEGRHGSLTAEEMAAAIREDGRVFAYAARANNG